MIDSHGRKIIIVRGAGDLATGTIHRLSRAGFHVLALETTHPMAIRRHVAFSEAVVMGEAEVEGICAVRVDSIEEARRIWINGVSDYVPDRVPDCMPDCVPDCREKTAHAGPLFGKKLLIPVMVDPEGLCIRDLKPFALVDAIIAKKNMGTHRDMAPLTIALGPGFTAGEDVDYVIETQRGHNLGRIICEGQASPNTGVPGIIGGYGAERVIHAPASGILHVIKDIGDTVEAGQKIAVIKNDTVTESVCSQISGLLRGMIRDGTPVHKGLKIADVDPRTDQYRNCFTISDKARCIAGSVLELVCAAVLNDAGYADCAAGSHNGENADCAAALNDGGYAVCAAASHNDENADCVFGLQEDESRGCVPASEDEIEACAPALSETTLGRGDNSARQILSGRIGCILMAAGWSRRFGTDKLLVPVNGKPLISHTMSQLRKLADAVPEADPYVIARRKEIAGLADEFGLDCILYEGGVQSDTIRRALELPGAEQWKGCMFIPADQPLLSAQSMKMLIDAFFQSPEKIHRLCADNTPGNPVIFPSSCFSALKQLQGDVGGRAVIRSGTVPVAMHEACSRYEMLDADSPEDLEKIIKAAEKQ